MKLFADPVAGIWFVCCLASVALLAKRRKRAAVVLMGVALLAGVGQVLDIPTRLVKQLERPFLGAAIAEVPTADAVVVLGGGLQGYTRSTTGFQMSESADRLVTGIALARGGKGKVLVLGGGLGKATDTPEAVIAKNWIESWKLAPVPVESLGVCANTREEAVRTSELAQKQSWRRVILVTSAWHQRRAVATFRKVGLEVIPVGCDCRGVFQREQLPFVPNMRSLVLLNLWLQESLGYVYYRLRTWV